MAKPARTSARSRLGGVSIKESKMHGWFEVLDKVKRGGAYPKGWRMLERFHTSKLQKTSTTTQIVALMASKNMRCDSAVRARDPCALYRTYAATSA